MHEVKCIRGSLEKNFFLGGNGKWGENGMMIMEKWNGGSKYVVNMNIFLPPPTESVACPHAT